MIEIIDTHKVEIDIPYGKLQSMIDWCNLNLDDTWNLTIISNAGQDSGNYVFAFHSASDLTKFILWMK